jgi:hypothetical protein
LLLLLLACERADVLPAPTSSSDEEPVAPRPPAAPPVAPVSAPSLADVREYVEMVVRSGYATREAIIGTAVEIYAEQMRGVDVRGAAARFVDEELEAQRRREATWTSPTDCDRLERAFSELDRSGIVARQNFSDCGTCGAAEIGGEMAAARRAGRKVRGYVFFHEQDSERAVDGLLYMNYGGEDPSEAAQLAIAREVVATLKQAGLHATWNGRRDTRIRVSPIDWKKRRFTRAPGLD